MKTFQKVSLTFMTSVSVYVKNIAVVNLCMPSIYLLG